MVSERLTRIRMTQRNSASVWMSVLTAILLLAVAAAPSAGTAQESEKSSDSPEKTAVNLDPNDPLYEAWGETVTAGQWEDIIRFYPPTPIANEKRKFAIELNDFSAETLRAGIEDFVERQAIAKKAREAGFSPDPERAERMQGDMEEYARWTWLERFGILENFQWSQEDIEKEYDRQKETSFKVWEELKFMNIFISRYEPYTVEEGDSLESIAKKISGDASKAGEIISLETKEPRAEMVEDSEGTEVSPLPLQTGEELLVPVNKEKYAELRQQAQEAYEALESGEEFREVGARYNESGVQPRPLRIRPGQDDKEIQQVIQDAFFKLEDGEYSEPLETRHGFQIVQRLEYIPAGYKPIEDVRSMLERTLENEKREGIYAEKMAELWDKDESIEIDREVLAATLKGEAEETDVLLQIDDLKYTVRQFQRDFGQQVDNETTVEEAMELFSNLPMIQRELYRQDMERLGIKESEPAKSRMQAIEDSYYWNLYPSYFRGQIEYEPTDEEIAAYYEENKSRFNDVRQAKMWQLSIESDEVNDAMTKEERNRILNEEVKKLRDDLTGVETAEQFQEFARKYSVDKYAEEGGYIGMINKYTHPQFQAYLNRSEGNFLVRPRIDREFGNRVVAYFVGEHVGGGQATLDEAREEIAERLTAEYRGKKYQELLDQAMDEAELEIFLPGTGNGESESGG